MKKELKRHITNLLKQQAMRFTPFVYSYVLEKKQMKSQKVNINKHINQRQRFHTRSRNKLGVEASPSSKLSINRGNIMSTTSDLLTATFRSASKRITLSCMTGIVSLSLST